MKYLIPLMLTLILLFTACSDVKTVETTTAYKQVEKEKGREDAVAMVLYDFDSYHLTPSHRIGNDEESVLIIPRYVGSKIRLYTIEATGTDSFVADGERDYTYEVAKDTTLELCRRYFEHNHMWYLEIETRDGKIYGSPLPYFCETEEDTIYIGKHWDGKNQLPYNWGEDEMVTETKPVIYLYPEEQTKVSVQLDYQGKLVCTYPEYKDGWNVTAYPDGTLTDDQGMTYNYLYWEGSSDRISDFSQGFCIPGSETASFLEEALAQLGLTRKEANEFIVYWLPLMERNPYNVISFQTTSYTETAKLLVTPEPDTVIRVFMAWYGIEDPLTIPPQELSAHERQGFTVVEWGGENVDP